MYKTLVSAKCLGGNRECKAKEKGGRVIVDGLIRQVRDGIFSNDLHELKDQSSGLGRGGEMAHAKALWPEVLCITEDYREGQCG